MKPLTPTLFFSIILILLLGGCWNKVEECSEIHFISDRDYYPAFNRLALRAEERIMAVLYLAKFHKGHETQVNMILEDLINAKKRGLDVRVLLEKSSWDSTLNVYNQEFIDSLTKYGITASLDSPSTTTHVKCVVFDGESALLGSTNWTTSALEYNNEINLQINDEEICRQIEEYINNLWEDK